MEFVKARIFGVDDFVATPAFKGLQGQSDATGARQWPRTAVASKGSCFELVGAAGLEPATPCLEDGFRSSLKVAYFQFLLFQTDTADLLKPVDSC
jgi:hypothetical protein